MPQLLNLLDPMTWIIIGLGLMLLVFIFIMFRWLIGRKL